MTKPIYVINGPNLNRLGKREPEIYGRTTLAEVEAMCREAAGDTPVVFQQSNAEYEIVNWVHEAIDEGAAILINPAGLSFTSIPILDALKMGPHHRVPHLKRPSPRRDLPQVPHLWGSNGGDRGARRRRLCDGDHLVEANDRRGSKPAVSGQMDSRA